MIDLIRRYPKAFGFSLLLHVVIIGLTLLELSSQSERKLITKPGTVDQTIKAEIVDQDVSDQQSRP